MLALIVLINVLGQGIHAKLLQDSNIESNQQKEDHAQFHPLQTTQEPLFTTTDQPTLTSIRNHNLTITMETFQQNPYLRAETNMKTPTYQEFVHLIDYKMMSIQKHNAKKFLMAHNQQVQYEQQVGFKSKKTRIELNKETPKEYFLHEEYLGYTACCLVYSKHKASLPHSKQQLAEAAKVLNMRQPVWINTTQTATMRER